MVKVSSRSNSPNKAPIKRQNTESESNQESSTSNIKKSNKKGSSTLCRLLSLLILIMFLGLGAFVYFHTPTRLSLLSMFTNQLSIRKKHYLHNHINHRNILSNGDNDDGLLFISKMITSSVYSKSLTNFGLFWYPKDDDDDDTNENKSSSSSSSIHTSSILKNIFPIKTCVWGNYRPDIYFGMKIVSKNIQTLSTGLVWTVLDHGNKQHGYNPNNYRHKTSQDELQVFEWIRHNGYNYGQQQLLDKLYQMKLTTSFLIFNNQDDHISNTDSDSTTATTTINLSPNHIDNLKWIQRIIVSPFPNNDNNNNKNSQQDKILLFYFGSEILSTPSGTIDADATSSNNNKEIIENIHILYDSSLDTADTSSTTASKPTDTNTNTKVIQTIKVGGYTAKSNNFIFEFRISATSNTKNNNTKGNNINIKTPPKMKISLLTSDTISNGVELMIDQHKRNALIPTTATATNNNNENYNFITLELNINDLELFLNDYTLDVIFYDNLPGANMESHTMTSKDSKDIVLSDTSTIDKLFHDHSLLFETTFNDKFPFNNNNNNNKNKNKNKNEFTTEEIQIAQHALSSLLGGVGYFHGQSLVSDGQDIDTNGGNSADMQDMNQIRQIIQQKYPNLLNTQTTNDNINDNNVITDDSTPTPNKKLQRKALSLLCSSPSRTSFPRGFLWDEGFHQLVISQYNINLSMQILISWLSNLHYYNNQYLVKYHALQVLPNTIINESVENNITSKNLGGWIPREMILGTEASARVPAEFIPQRVNIANPPTLFLVVEKYFEKYEKLIFEKNEYESCPTTSTSTTMNNNNNNNNNNNIKTTTKATSTTTDNSKSCEKLNDKNNNNNNNKYNQILKEISQLQSFFIDSIEPLHDWLTWFLVSQSGTQTGTYRWRGRSRVDRSKMLANTLASGLDDYPRGAVPTTDEYHLGMYVFD